MLFRSIFRAVVGKLRRVRAELGRTARGFDKETQPANGRPWPIEVIGRAGVRWIYRG